MNAQEFNAKLGLLVDQAMQQGVVARKMGVVDVVGILEITKSEILRQAQDMARIAAAAKAPVIHLPRPGGRLPGV